MRVIHILYSWPPQGREIRRNQSSERILDRSDYKRYNVGARGARARGFHVVKRILLHTLRGLAHMHHCQIVHTDLTHDNIMFGFGSITQDDIAMFIKTNPARRHPPEESWECVVQAAVSQPLPLPRSPRL